MSCDGLPNQGPIKLLVLACGALGRELMDILRLNGLAQVTVQCLPASLHNRPHLIPEAVRDRVVAARDQYDEILVGYADCGTGGLLDRVCAQEGVSRLPGPHCYASYAGQQRFMSMHSHDPTAFYLTDYLVKHFDRLVIDGLGIERHPELLESYFARYTRVIYFSQVTDENLLDGARRAARRLGLEFEHMATGYGELESTVTQFVELTGLKQPSAVATSPVPEGIAHD